MLDSSPDGYGVQGRRSFLRRAGAVAVSVPFGGAPGGRTEEPESYPRPMDVDAPPALEPHPDARNPVLSGADVEDRDGVTYVADPFVAATDGTYHLFFEVAYESEDPAASPDIAHATSDDGLAWTYEGVVLDDPLHLAYPAVRRVDGTWYMTPDKSTYRYGGLPEFRIYRADPFPSEWTLVERPLVNEHVGDPTLLRRDGTWYLFSIEQESTYGTRLHSADSLREGDWTEHPDSPVTTDPRNYRPAGRPVVDGESLYLPFQDVERTYGDKVRCFEVTALTESDYEHEEIDTSPLVAARDDGGWADQGMHHVDASLAYREETDAVLVDGKDAEDRWSLGVYRLSTSDGDGDGTVIGRTGCRAGGDH